MSWSITLIGQAANVVKALNEQSTKFEGQTKVEYDAALPHLVGLVEQNFGSVDPLIKIAASGHGYAADGQQVIRQCMVQIENIYGQIV